MAVPFNLNNIANAKYKYTEYIIVNNFCEILILINDSSAVMIVMKSYAAGKQ